MCFDTVCLLSMTLWLGEAGIHAALWSSLTIELKVSEGPLSLLSMSLHL